MEGFWLKIEMGNDAMQTTNDIAAALLEVVHQLEIDNTHGPVMDRNGNTVGIWEVK